MSFCKICSYSNFSITMGRVKIKIFLQSFPQMTSAFRFYHYSLFCSKMANIHTHLQDSKAKAGVCWVRMHPAGCRPLGVCCDRKLQPGREQDRQPSCKPPCDGKATPRPQHPGPFWCAARHPSEPPPTPRLGASPGHLGSGRPG